MLRIFENRVRRETLGSTGKEVKRSGYNRLLAPLSKYYSDDQSRNMEWAVHEACRETKNDECKVLVDKSEGKRLPVRPGENLRIILKLNFTKVWERGPD